MQILRPVGILDKAVGENLLAQARCLLDDERCDIWVDCELLTFMDSSGLGCIIQTLKHARSVERDVHLCRVNCQLKAVLELTCADRVFQIHEAVPIGLESSSSSAGKSMSTTEQSSRKRPDPDRFIN